mmetsp:Transcript_26373/g.56648  ORF Transcript_26373/g.56648 Transcript_26373/m.56648 type:complete len:307 (+) Transcript_26373:872-1792(+)
MVLLKSQTLVWPRAPATSNISAMAPSTVVAPLFHLLFLDATAGSFLMRLCMDGGNVSVAEYTKVCRCTGSVYSTSSEESSLSSSSCCCSSYSSSSISIGLGSLPPFLWRSIAASIESSNMTNFASPLTPLRLFKRSSTSSSLSLSSSDSSSSSGGGLAKLINSKICLSWGKEPCLIIRSASSITRKRSWVRLFRWEYSLLDINSHNRPGVATITGGRTFSKVRFCLTSANPPTMVPILMVSIETFWSSDVTCMANSRVGVNMRACSGNLSTGEVAAEEDASSGGVKDWADVEGASFSNRYCRMGNP